MTVKQAVDAFMRAARQVVGDDMPPNVESWWRGYDLRRKRSRAYRTPTPVYATCPSCRAWVRRFVTLHPALCWCPDCGGFPTWQGQPPATTLTVQLADDEEPPKGWKRTATDEDGRMR